MDVDDTRPPVVRCAACPWPRLPGDPMRDAVLHGQCDTRLTLLDPDRPDHPTWSQSYGAAAGLPAVQ